MRSKELIEKYSAFPAIIGNQLADLGQNWLNEAQELKQKHFIPESGWDDEIARTRYATLTKCCEQLIRTVDREVKK